jgi:alkylation response protein AidB-like acyl-CoA dehydrogenase
MYNLHLSPEQLEIRDTVRDFVMREIKPVALKAERLDVCDRRLPMGLLDQASQMGLRSLALSEERGGIKFLSDVPPGYPCRASRFQKYYLAEGAKNKHTPLKTPGHLGNTEGIG